MTAKPVHFMSKPICFGPFRLDPERRELSLEGEPIRLRAREFDILAYLIDRAGEFVTKEELTEKVWAVTYVSEANIRVQIAALRRVLGDNRDNPKYIASAAGRGYTFCAQILSEPATSQTPRLPKTTVNGNPRYNLPIRLKPTLGRGEASHRLIRQLPHQRLVTIVGTGGIGKTTLALTAVETLLDAYDDGVRFIDLASLSDPNLIASTIAGPLGLKSLSAVLEDDVVRYLKSKQILLLMDNCEHLIEAIAALVERILTQTRDVHFLATSREPLRADGEWLFRLGPLDVPPRTNTLTASEAIAYPAVKLFVDRARLGDSLFEFRDADALIVAELCRRLDGNPLAVELAAARVGLFGVQGLANQLDETFKTLTQGRRTALPRHQTLRATLDWSYEILTPAERALLYRLSIFRGEFTLTIAKSVAVTETVQETDVLEGLASLAAKSLINVDISSQPARYRMLFLTRDYAFEKLVESGEFDTIAGRHARSYLALLHSNTVNDVANFSWIDDIRTAIDWAFSPQGDVLLAVKLISSSLALGRHFSLLPEYGRRIDQALERMHELNPPEPLLQIRLLIERAHILLHTDGNYDEMVACSAQARQVADDAFESTEHNPLFNEVLAMQFGIAFGRGDSPALLSLAQETRDRNAGGLENFETWQMTTRMQTQAWHFLGNHDQSLAAAKALVDVSEKRMATRNYMRGDRQNPVITVRIFQARSQWIMGNPETASVIAKEAAQMAEPQGVQHCFALGMAVIPVALWRGNYIEAKQEISRLGRVSEECGLGYWVNWARVYEGVISFCENDLEVDDPLDAFQKIIRDTIQWDQLSTFHENLISSEMLNRVETGKVGWNAPEVLRATAERKLAMGTATPDETEDLLLRSLELARVQKALSWQIRTATSLGRLWRYKGKEKDAKVLLSDTLGRIVEGSGDSDYIAAEAVLTDLEQRLPRA